MSDSLLIYARERKAIYFVEYLRSNVQEFPCYWKSNVRTFPFLEKVAIETAYTLLRQLKTLSANFSFSLTGCLYIT